VQKAATNAWQSKHNAENIVTILGLFCSNHAQSLAGGIAVLLALLLSVAAAVAQKSTPQSDLVIAQPVANMHAHAAAESEVVSQVLYGTGVLALEKQGDWTHVRTADGYTGWVAASDMRPQGATLYAPEGRSIHVVALSANIYEEPDVTRRPALLQLPWEAILETVPQPSPPDIRWLKVRLVDHRTAWVQRGDVGTDTAPLTIDETIALARRFLGVTYTWGGVSSFGFDCSGFTQMLIRRRGIEMPRDADLQATWSGAEPVERKDLAPGDLLFFGASPAKITHTGMYIGHGEFIHDTTHDHPGVQISRLDDMPWTKLFVAARRVK